MKEDSPFFIKSLMPEDIEKIEEKLGRKTINQIRDEAGLDPVPGGEIAYSDYLRRLVGFPIPKVH